MTNILKTLALAISVALLSACGANSNKNASQNSSNLKNSENSATILTVDKVVDPQSADSLLEKVVTIEGVCTHICKHAGRKIFLQGSDDRHIIRIEAAEIGRFDRACVNNIVKVTGTLHEFRIDEEYLKTWEESLNETQPEGEEGCENDAKARNEVGNTVAERIQFYRNHINARMKTEGKPYVSTYFINAISYEIQAN